MKIATNGVMRVRTFRDDNLIFKLTEKDLVDDTILQWSPTDLNVEDSEAEEEAAILLKRAEEDKARKVARALKNSSNAVIVSYGTSAKPARNLVSPDRYFLTVVLLLIFSSFHRKRLHQVT